MPDSRLFISLFVRGVSFTGLECHRCFRFRDLDEVNKYLTDAYNAIETETVISDSRHPFLGMKIIEAHLVLQHPDTVSFLTGLHSPL